MEFTIEIESYNLFVPFDEEGYYTINSEQLKAYKFHAKRITFLSRQTRSAAQQARGPSNTDGSQKVHVLVNTRHLEHLAVGATQVDLGQS